MNRPFSFNETFMNVNTPFEKIGTEDLHIQVSKMAEVFREFDIKRLAFISSNSPGSIIVEMAAFEAEIILIPIPTFFTEEQVISSLHKCEADYILADRDKSSFGEIYRLINTAHFNYGLFKTKYNPDHLPGVSRITFTSGTTASPKGVLLSRETLESRAFDLNKRINGSSKDTFLSFMPYSILLETMTGIYLPMINNADAYIINGIEAPLSDPQKAYHYLSESGASVTVMMPHMVQALANFILKNELPVPEKLRFIGAGGAKMSRELLLLAEEACLPVYQGYGLSEAGSVITLNNSIYNRRGSVGRVLDSLKVRISDGEIEVKGMLSTGYSDSSCNFTRDGWLKTGDLGRLDEDGFLYVDGRKSNVIITSNGRNISPEWIESELNSFRGISASFVIGEGRLTPLAFCSFCYTPEPESVLREVNKRLPGYAQLSTIIPVEHNELTKGEGVSPNGRIKREVLEKILTDKFNIGQLNHEWV